MLFLNQSIFYLPAIKTKKGIQHSKRQKKIIRKKRKRHIPVCFLIVGESFYQTVFILMKQYRITVLMFRFFGNFINMLRNVKFVK